MLVAAGVVLACALAFVLYWFQPHKLFIDERVDEALPTAEAGAAPGETSGTDVPRPTTRDTTASSPTTTTTDAGPVDIATGTFVSLDHGTSGTVRVLELADASRFVRFEGLDTDNGPDLFVYLSTNPASGPEQGFDDDYLDLGRLKGNQGDQNYELPPGTDLSRFQSVVIWCDRFDSAFGAADLVPVDRP